MYTPKWLMHAIRTPNPAPQTLSPQPKTLSFEGPGEGVSKTSLAYRSLAATHSPLLFKEGLDALCAELVKASKLRGGGLGTVVGVLQSTGLKNSNRVPLKGFFKGSYKGIYKGTVV